MEAKKLVLAGSEGKRKGQTLLEFAITLPILLVLMFGIIEFGRIFQAWVSLQNAARTAARFASTGGYEPYFTEDQLDTIVPCVDTDGRGPVSQKYPIQGDASVSFPAFSPGGGGSERLFATWFNGLDCDPANSSDTELREDILRLMAIYIRAAEGAGGLAIAPVDVENITDENSAYNFITSVWNPNYPQLSPDLSGGQGSTPVTGANDLDGYFSVMICSDRDFLDSDSSVIFEGSDLVPGDDYSPRFISVTDPNDPLMPSVLADHYQQMIADGIEPMPGCFLNESSPDNPLAYNSSNPVRWLDAGAGGNRVTVSVSFHHPLITPLGLAPNIPIHARRSAIVEDFRVSAVAPAPPPAGDLPPPPDGDDGEGEGDPDATPDATDEATPEPTPEVQPTTDYSEPFACENVYLTAIDFGSELEENDKLITFRQGRVVFSIYNANNDSAILQSAKLNWASREYIESIAANDPIDPVPLHDGFFFAEFTLSGRTIWTGESLAPETVMTQANEAIVLRPQSASEFSAYYRNGPDMLNGALPRGAFSGTEFVVINPDTGEACENTLMFTSTTEDLDDDEEIIPEEPLESCASNTVKAGFGDFVNNRGWLYFTVENRRSEPAPISDFAITWGRREDRNEGAALRLRSISIGGDSAPLGDPLWESTSETGIALTLLEDRGGFENQDTPNLYDPVERVDGVWTHPGDVYNIPAKSTRKIWLTFISDDIEDEGLRSSDFNGTTFNIGCASNGSEWNGGGGGWGGGEYNDLEGPIEIIENPTPPPTVDPANNPPTANNDTDYELTVGTTKLVVPDGQGVLINDTDCPDTTVGRATNGTPCTQAQANSGNPSNFTANGDDPLRMARCTGGCLTDKLARIDFNTYGGFTYDISQSDALYCQATGTLTDTYTYTMKDSRGATSTATVTITVNASGPSNTRPVHANTPTFTIDMRNTETISGPSNKNNSNNMVKAIFTDADNDNMTLTDLPGPYTNHYKYGTLQVNADGSWFFDPRTSSQLLALESGKTKTYTFDVDVDDGKGKCSTASGQFKIKIIGAAQPEPEVTDDPLDDRDLGGEGCGGDGC